MLMSTQKSKEMSLDSCSALSAPAPRTVEETGLPFLFLVELLVKVLFLRGQMRLIELSSHLKLSIGVIDALTSFVRAEKLCEITNGGSTNAGLAYRLTDAGRARAAEFIGQNAYAGAAPVTLAAYCAQVEAQSVATMRISREEMVDEFADIVVKPAVLDQLGAAMNSGRALFIHGPAGSGKTFLAERLAGLLKGDIAVPHAILAGGEVVQIHDTMLHPAPDNAAIPSNAFDQRIQPDARWVRCVRPAVLTGGELTLDMLDLQFDPRTRFYQAPPHLKANNGIFIIDDLGRQRCSASDLMNRWIVPLDRRVDYLSLHTGYKFSIPFDVIVVFSSNLLPEKLADDSFLRRLGYKIHIGPLTESQYERVFAQVCQQFGLGLAGDAFQYLLHRHHYKEERPLLACYPRDILGQIRDLARYEGKIPVLDEKVMDWAWDNYFSSARSQ